VQAGDLVIYLDDPLKFGGEMLVLKIDPEGRLLCEAVNFDEGETPLRALLWPQEVELASVWARAS
jgi:hypothetical protein